MVGIYYWAQPLNVTCLTLAHNGIRSLKMMYTRIVWVSYATEQKQTFLAAYQFTIVAVTIVGKNTTSRGH